MKKTHDTGYKELFSHPEIVQQLMQGFVPNEISRLLNYSTLTLHNGNYITPLFKEKFEDCVWSVELHPETKTNKTQQGQPTKLYLFILLEFQSSDDKTMPLRMLHYTASFYHQLIKEQKLNLKTDKLPLVFPCVLYNGDDKWQTPTSFIKLLPTLPSFLKKYQPQLHYYLIDEKQLDAKALEQSPYLLSGVFGVEQANDDTDASRAIWLIQRKLATYPDHEKERLAQLLSRWIEHYLHNSSIDINLSTIDLLEEKPMSLRKFVLEQKEEARKEAEVIYLNKGREQGLEQGREDALKENVLNLHRNLNLSAEQIAKALQIPLEKVTTILS